MKTSKSISDILREELRSRQQKNENYSLRSFARGLGISPSFLSKVIRGEREVSAETLQKLGSRLQMDSVDLKRLLSATTSTEFSLIKAEQFKMIADWYHYAILELVTVAHFQSSPKWIAKELGISERTADEAVARLLSLGLLKSEKSGKALTLSSNNTSMSSGIPSSAHTEHERQVLEAAKKALDNVGIEHRHQSSVTLAIPISRVSEAREKIKKFRRELMASLQRPGEREAVYQMSFSFFPITNINNKETEL